MEIQEFRVSFPSPIGTVSIIANERGIVSVAFTDDVSDDATNAPAFLHEGRRQLLEYFAGERRTFGNLPLVLRATDFQRSVWGAAGEIPFGQTMGYKELARTIGSPDGARAVGAALGRNAIAIIIPCHRIVMADDSGGGYAWGEERKRWLLAHERKQ